MIKRQIELVKKKIQDQASIVFGTERRKRRGYRNYLEHLYSIQSFSKDKESFMTIVTLSHRALYDIWKDGGEQEVWDLLSDGKPYIKKDS